MPSIRPTDWQTQASIFEAYGCRFVRQKGDHLVYEYPKARRPVIIPRYKEVPVSVIKANINTVGMTREEYFALLEAI